MYPLTCPYTSWKRPCYKFHLVIQKPPVHSNWFFRQLWTSSTLAHAKCATTNRQRTETAWKACIKIEIYRNICFYVYQYPNLSVKIPLRYFSLLPAFSMSGNRHQAASFRQEGHVHSLTFFSANPLAKVMPLITQNFSETRIWFALGGVDHTKLCVRKIWLAIGAPSPPKSDFDAAKLWRSANFSMRLARAVYWTLLVFSAVLAANL